MVDENDTRDGGQGQGADAGLSPEQFRADLEVFSGPLDLLLHLIRRNEVDVLEIAVSRITDRYLAALHAMEMFDVNGAADFLVMAATLMDIKSRSLLPELPADEEEEADPRHELVRHLLQYKRFKQLAARLEELAAGRALRFAPVTEEPAVETVPPDLENLLADVSIWDVVSAYAEVVRQTRTVLPTYIVYDEVPTTAYMDEIAERLAREQGPVEFLDFFSHDRSRARFIGIFLALLELVAQGRVLLQQPEGDRTRITVAPAPADALRGVVDVSGSAGS